MSFRVMSLRLACLGGLLVGCSGESAQEAPPADTGVSDATSDVVTDTGTPDTAPSDAGGDGDTATDTALAPVIVTMKDAKANPVTGIEVAFTPKDGTPTIIGTDATGKAASALPAGSSVTVYVPAGPKRPPAFYTYLDVSPGEALTLVFSALDKRDVDIKAEAYAGADAYGVDVCGAAIGLTIPPGTILDKFPDCGDLATGLPTAFVARKAGLPIAYATKAAKPGDAGTTAFVSMTSADWVAASTPFGIGVKGTKPADATSSVIQWSFLHDGRDYFAASNFFDTTLTPSVTTAAPPTSFAPTLRRSIRVAHAGGERSLLVQEPTPTKDVAFDAATLLEEVTGTFTGPTDAPTLVMTTASKPTSGGIVYVLAGTKESDALWIVRAPLSMATATLPKLPPTFAAVVSPWAAGNVIMLRTTATDTAAKFRAAPVDIDARVIPTIGLPKEPIDFATSSASLKKI